jgi:hypothetical protein
MTVQIDMFVFLDESGQTGGIGKAGSQKTFTATSLAIKGPAILKNMERALSNFEGKLITAGWPKSREIKASRLFKMGYDNAIKADYKFKNDGPQLIRDVLNKLVEFDIMIDHITVRKDGIISRLRDAPYGILYNYYSSRILVPRISNEGNVQLIADARSKESHPNLKFDGYIETEIYQNSTKPIYLEITHVDSSISSGVRMVDYFCWAINRKYEHGDDRFYKIIESKLCEKKMYFF